MTLSDSHDKWLWERFRGRSEKARRKALSKLVLAGQIKYVLSSIATKLQCRHLGPGDVAAVINTAESPDELVFQNLANATTAYAFEFKEIAIDTCGLLKTGHPVVLEALTQTLGRLEMCDTGLCVRAAFALGRLRSCAPVVLEALIVALRDDRENVAKEARSALKKIEKNHPGEVRAALAAQPDPIDFGQLMTDFSGADVAASKRAIEELMKVRAIWECPANDSSRVYGHDLDSVGKLANKIGATHEKPFAGLAQVIVGRWNDIRWRAIWICQRIKMSHPVVLEALARAVSVREESTRRFVVETLGKIGVPSPVVLKGLAVGLRDSDMNVVIATMQALRELATPHPDVVEGLLPILNASDYYCRWSLWALKSIGAYDRKVLEAIRRVASGASGHSEWTQKEALETLAAIPLEAITPANSRKSVLNDEDKRILSWFNDERVNMAEYLTPLQVFWCVGRIERKAMESAGPAIGWHKLSRRLLELKPLFKFVPLPTGVTYLSNAIPNLDGLFDKEPFYSHAWSDEERQLELRPDFLHGKRVEARWTAKASKCWVYVDTFLTLEDLLPTITIGSD